MKEIQLTQGKVALVDDDVFEELNQYNWHYHCGYAQSWLGGKTNVKMHRVIMDAQKGMEVDHINGNGTDNRKENLRICNHSENQHNQHGNSSNKSGFKGVYFAHKKWCSQITFENKKIYLGIFDIPEDAARAYDEAARKYFGEFARLNFA